MGEVESQVSKARLGHPVFTPFGVTPNSVKYDLGNFLANPARQERVQKEVSVFVAIEDVFRVQ